MAKFHDDCSGVFAGFHRRNWSREILNAVGRRRTSAPTKAATPQDGSLGQQVCSV